MPRVANPHMAIFHLSVKAIGRANGRSATAAAAYRAASRIEDERTGLVHDYTRKTGVVHREIAVPDGAPHWAQDRVQLWNAAELAETRKNSTVAREFEVALPGELAAPERRHLASSLAQEIAARHRCAVDVAIHAPGRGGDNRNHHAHLLMTTRRLEASGFTEKTRELDDLKTGEVTRWRERWATLVNEHLEEHGHRDRVDHRSLEAQGVDREATSHKGPAVTAIERRGEVAHVTYRHLDEAAERLRIAVELSRLERASSEVKRSIIDTSTELRAAIADRDRTRTAEQVRRDAQAAWLASRATAADATAAARPASERTLDLTGDLGAASREAREQGLAERTSAQPPSSAAAQGAEPKTPSRLILPDDDLTK